MRSLFLHPGPGRSDYIGEVLVSWLPPKVSPYQFTTCDKSRRISGASRCKSSLNRKSCDGLRRFEHFVDRVSFAAAAKIVDGTRRGGFERKNVSSGKVDNVDIIAHASAVARGI